MSDGIVYILTNQAMPGYVKLGKTTTAVGQRMRELDTTSVPLLFECFFAARVANCDFVEKKLHEAFGDQRVRSSREFFHIGPERIKAALEIAALEDVTPRVDVVDNPEDEEALNAARQRRANFSFNAVGIPVGAELHSSFDPNMTCTVAGARKVNFQGAEMSLSAAALQVARGKSYQWPSIAGPAYWLYNSKSLAQIRADLENGESGRGEL